jgi:hypothetical protein
MNICHSWPTVGFPAAAGALASVRAVLLEFSDMCGIGGLKPAAVSPLLIPRSRKE